MDSMIGLSQSLKTEQTLSPQMLQSLALLPMPILELKAHIQAEIESNPALEIPDSEYDMSIGGQEASLDDRMDDADSSYYEDSSYDVSYADPEASDRKQMMIENSSAPGETLKEHLMVQLGEVPMPERIRTIAETLISNLDQNGFFMLSLDALFENSGYTESEIAEAVDIVQNFDPAGICVQDFRQSLILQAKLSGMAKEDLAIFSEMVNEHLEKLKSGKFKEANEAPPAIISMYLGDQLADVIDQLEKGDPKSSKQAGALKLGSDTLPPLPRDATDRNRTSPFAFTGNKFEFRAPGSSQSCSEPNVILNTIVAEAFDLIADKMQNVPADKFHEELQNLLQKIVKEHKKVIFNGNGYTDEWVEEAAKRGLPNIRTTMEALQALTKKENVALFEKYGVFNKRELDSRYEVNMEDYHKKIHIEGKIAFDIAKNVVLPQVLCAYGNALKTNEMAKTQGFYAVDGYARELGEKLKGLEEAIAKMEAALGDKHEAILDAMANLRIIVDKIESIVPDEKWPLPKYREMLFIY